MALLAELANGAVVVKKESRRCLRPPHFDPVLDERLGCFQAGCEPNGRRLAIPPVVNDPTFGSPTLHAREERAEDC